MSGRRSHERAALLDLKPGGGADTLRKLVLDGLFDAPVTSAQVVHRISEVFTERWATNEVQPFIAGLIRGGVLHGVKPDGGRETYWVIQDVPRVEALRMISKGRKVVELEGQLFSNSLLAKLAKDFKRELDELHDNFGKNGNATAFLLRKILEKLLIIVFGKLGKGKLLEDPARPGGWRGLKEMVDIAAREKVSGLPLLTGKTANEIRAIKFLGDTAAHNPLVNVEVETILPQMPFIITAYEELARHL